MVILNFSALNDTNLQVLTLLRYDEHPCHFYMGVPTRGGGGGRYTRCIVQFVL